MLEISEIWMLRACQLLPEAGRDHELIVRNLHRKSAGAETTLGIPARVSCDTVRSSDSTESHAPTTKQQAGKPTLETGFWGLSRRPTQRHPHNCPNAPGNYSVPQHSGLESLTEDLIKKHLDIEQNYPAAIASQFAET